MAGLNEQIMEMLKANNNHILELVKKSEFLTVKVTVLDKTIDNLKDKHEELSTKNTQLIGMISDRMTPDRCGHMHNELRSSIKKEVFSELRKGAKGWMSTALTILKFAAYAAIVFGGSAVGANALGILKIAGGP